MKNIFGTDKTAQLKGAMQFGTSEILIGGSSEGFVVQSIQAGMQRDITKLYEIGSTNMYYAAGRMKGQGTLRNVIGLSESSISGMVKFGKLCPLGNTTNNEIVIKAPSGDNVCGTGNLTKQIKFTGAALTGITINAQADQDVITGDWSYMFCDVQTDA